MAPSKKEKQEYWQQYYANLKEDPVKYQARLENRRPGDAIRNAAISEFKDIERLLNTEMETDILFETVSDVVVFEVLKSAIAYKLKCASEAGRAVDWAQREALLLKAKRIKGKPITGMDKVSALNLLNVLEGLGKDLCGRGLVYIEDALIEHGFKKGPRKNPEWKNDYQTLEKAWLERAKASVKTSKLLKVNFLFEVLDDNVIKTLFDSIEERKRKLSLGLTSERTIDWADREMHRLHELGMKGMEQVSAFNLFHMFRGWTKKNQRTIVAYKSKLGYTNSESLPKRGPVSKSDSAPKKKRALQPESESVPKKEGASKENDVLSTLTLSEANDFTSNELCMMPSLDSLPNGFAALDDETFEWLDNNFDIDEDCKPPADDDRKPPANDDRKPPADDDHKLAPFEITNFYSL